MTRLLAFLAGVAVGIGAMLALIVIDDREHERTWREAHLEQLEQEAGA